MEIKENKSDLRFEQEDDAVWVFSGDSHQGTEISHLITSHIDDYNEDDVRLICHYAANEIDRLRAKLAKATPEGFVLVPKTESTGLTDKKGRIIFVGDVVEFVGGCVEFLDLSGYGSSKYIVNKGDKMIVRKLKSGYTLSLPWIDCNTPNRAGNLGNYDFWNLQRDFVVIEAQEQSYD